MLITTFGWRHSTLDQISRIEKGFLELGHQLVTENPDFIFSNNPSYEEPLLFSKKWPNAKIIFNVLDVAIHVDNYPFDLIKSQLAGADAVCSISLNTQKEVKRIYGFDSTIIYNPVKKTYRNPDIKKDVFCLWVGRLDTNKRFGLVVETLQKLGIKQEDFIVCGSENPYWGTYYGLVSDEILNDLYNRSKYLISATKVSGIELGIPEAAMAGCIPIACGDNQTPYEFLERFFITDPNPNALAAKIQEIEKSRVLHSSYFIQTSPMRYQKLSGLSVAKSIINCYTNLLPGENQSAPRQEGLL